jgi:hypothetical protein
MAKDKEVAVVADEESLALLRNQFPVEQGFQRQSFPRLGFYSQDVTEGKGKAMKVVTEAGTFYTEKQTDELDENGKKVWVKEEIGPEVELVILYKRHQLKFFDGEAYTSSTVYDEDNEIVTLFKGKEVVEKGLPKELQALPQYQGKSAKGKDISKLEDTRILYVLYQGEVHQMNLRGSSMYAFLSYSRSQSPNTVLTKITSEPKENGSISWNQMVFTAVRPVNAEEVAVIHDKTAEIKGNIEAEKGYFAAKNGADGSVSVVEESEADRIFRGLKSGPDA